ncbi:hypothetical protein GWK50_19335 (plasmid) [Acidovorax sp. 210-6]|uniref:LPD7 domain-containing protein n=1 Tax=Acidovorax sp. 210-6 TaxID=2699468 RepID=UPI0013894BF8|nr:LPD7 domain-containing protein [Acidovorax sp. 210-6]NCU67979.1 hypothetical protein [Acidovorax sp. 210-6]
MDSSILNNEASQYRSTPLVGAMEIDGKPATAVRFERVEREGRAASYNVTFTLDSKTVSKLKGLTADTLQDAVGDKNAKAILEGEAKGTLKGSALAFECGLSPEENARRIIEKEDRKIADMATIDPRIMETLATKRAAESDAIRQQLAEQREEAINAVSKGKREREQGTRVDGGDNEVQSDEIFSTAEEDRLPLIPPDVAAKYIKVGDKYHFQRNPEAVAFQDRGNKLETQTNSPAVAESMVKIAQARGWDEIRVTGTESFKREVWFKAASQGMHVRGYTPNDADLAKLEAIKKDDFRAREKLNSVEGERTRDQKMAETFKSATPERAIKEFPELAAVYAGVEAARRKAGKERLSEEETRVVMNRISHNAAKSIERGHIPQINVREQEQARTKEKEPGKSSNRENELER